MFKIYNPINWGETAYVVVNGVVTQAFNYTYSTSLEKANEEFHSQNFDIKDYEIITISDDWKNIHERVIDAYPEDDPGHCFYNWYEVC